MHPSAARVADLWLYGRGEVDHRRIKRVEQRSKTLFHDDQRALSKFVDKAERDFKALSKSRPLAAIAAAVKEKVPVKNRPYQFAKALRSSRKVNNFIEKYVGADRGGSIRYKLRDLRYKKTVDPIKVYASVRAAANSWFRESRISEAQAPLRQVLPEELMRFLPSSIHVEVDEGGVITRMTDRFVAERESLAKKVAIQHALVKQYNAIAKIVKGDLKSRDETRRLAALVTSIIMETGIRPGKLGNKAFHVVDGEKVGVETFGAVTLGPEHVRSLREGFLELEFVGKMGTTNLASLSDGTVIKVLDQYVEQARQGGSKFVFVTKKGDRFEYANLARYFQKRLGKWLRPTDFRKLRSTETQLSALIAQQKTLYAAIREFVKNKVVDLEARIVAEIVKALEIAVEAARSALSHDKSTTTIEKYINPEVVLRFLAQGGRIDSTLSNVILSGQPTLAFNTETFIAQAMRSAAGDLNLMNLLSDIEDDLSESGARP